MQNVETDHILLGKEARSAYSRIAEPVTIEL